MSKHKHGFANFNRRDGRMLDSLCHLFVFFKGTHGKLDLFQ